MTFRSPHHSFHVLSSQRRHDFDAPCLACFVYFLLPICLLAFVFLQCSSYQPLFSRSFVVDMFVNIVAQIHTIPANTSRANRIVMQYRFKPVSNHLWKWIDSKRIQCELRLMRIQCERKRCELIRFQCALLS